VNNNAEFQIVCVECGSLSIKIENPITASRQAIVYCGDCGASRGTMGSLRDLAVQPNAGVIWPTKPQSPSEISEQFSELQSLRRQVQIAESLGREPKRRLTIVRLRKGNATIIQ
jgi:hypothetical protein